MIKQDASSSDGCWFVYILECCDGTLYTGITTDIARRLIEHNTSNRGAKYTRSRRPVHLLAFSRCTSRSDALREEIRIKRLSREKKVEMIRRMCEQLKNDP